MQPLDENVPQEQFWKAVDHLQRKCIVLSGLSTTHPSAGIYSLYRQTFREAKFLPAHQ